METLRQDVRFALRAFARRPGFSLSAILSLAIGIAASSAVFSLINAALFKPLPGVSRPERLVEIARDVGSETGDVTWEVFSRLRQERAVLEDVSAMALVSASIAGANEPVARGGLAITGNYFDLLGVRAARGRLFMPDESPAGSADRPPHGEFTLAIDGARKQYRGDVGARHRQRESNEYQQHRQEGGHRNPYAGRQRTPGTHVDLVGMQRRDARRLALKLVGDLGKARRCRCRTGARSQPPEHLN